MAPWIDLGMVVLVALMVAVVGLGVAGSAHRAGYAAAAARGLAARVVAALAGWLTLSGALAALGVLSVWTAIPPRWPLLPLTALLTLIVLVTRPATRRLIAHTPRHWLIGAQTFRVGVELVLYGLHATGRAPEQLTFAGRNFDILVGLTAPVVAYLVATERLPPIGVLVWNVCGLALLVNAVGTVATSTPGPLHHAWPGEPFTAIATWPIVWLPAFLAPLALFLHVASLRQTLASLRRKPAASAS